MISRRKRDKHRERPPLSDWAIRRYIVFVLGIAVASGTVLWCLYGGASARVQLDAIRTASAITVAAGGAVALLLAARRQQSTEQTLEHQRQTLEHQREVAQATDRDAGEQRITELYAHAVDQLGAEKAPVRLGGLHALERLAQINLTQRQTIVDVICAYLRMPYTPPDDHPPGEDAPQDAHTRHEERRQELQVRLTAQRILADHLKPEATEVFWANIDLNLTEAQLHQLDLSDCQVRSAQFGGATFTGWGARFGGATFAGDAWFALATFIVGYTEFGGATFVGNAGFYGATFTGWNANFGGASFTGEAGFGGATFIGDALFSGATFAGNARFDEVRVASRHRAVLPMGWATRPAAEGEEEGWLYVVRDEDSSEQSGRSAG